MGNLGRSVTNTLAMVMSLVLVNHGVMYMKTYNDKNSIITFDAVKSSILVPLSHLCHLETVLK